MPRFIRVIHPKHFDYNKKRFSSLAFRNSSNNGISVFELECTEIQGRPLCEHIHAFYPNPISGDPTIFWVISEDELPIGLDFIKHPSSSGDDCHVDIVGLNDKQARNMLISKEMSDFKICLDNGSYRSLSINDMPELN
jgi:hypothetical protein